TRIKADRPISPRASTRRKRSSSVEDEPGGLRYSDFITAQSSAIFFRAAQVAWALSREKPAKRARYHSALSLVKEVVKGKWPSSRSEARCCTIPSRFSASASDMKAPTWTWKAPSYLLRLRGVFGAGLA